MKQSEIIQALTFSLTPVSTRLTVPQPCNRKRARETLAPEVWLRYNGLTTEDISDEVLSRIALELKDDMAELMKDVRQVAAANVAAAVDPTKVDYKQCLDVIHSNSKKALSQCVSCFSEEQHALWKSHISTRLESSSSSQAHSSVNGGKTCVPEMVLDLIYREQGAFLGKWREHVIGCSLCNLERHKRKSKDHHNEAEKNHSSHEYCLNHNFVPNEALKCCSEIIDRCNRLLQSVSASDGHHVDNLLQPSPVFLFPKGEQMGSSSSSFSSVAQREALSNEEKKTAASSSLPLATFPPCFKLVIDQRWNPNNAISNTHAKVQSIAHSGSAEKKALFSLISSSIPAKHSAVLLHTSLSSLVRLACTHMKRDDTRIPLQISHPSDNEILVSLFENCPSHLTRRQALEETFLACIENEAALSIARKSRTSVSLLLTTSNGTRVVVESEVWKDADSDRCTIPMVKMEYSCKGYNELLDDPEAISLELFTTRELLFMSIALQIHPQAQVVVHRVNAYTSSVIGVETFTLSKFTSMMKSTSEMTQGWCSMTQLLDWLNTFAAQVPSSSCPVTLCMTSNTQAGSISLTARNPAMETQQVSLEPSSLAVARREYCMPCMWAHMDRIPFTYHPRSKSEDIINRFRSVRDADAYAAHDVWTHSSKTYKVVSDGTTTVATEQSQSCDGGNDVDGE